MKTTKHLKDRPPRTKLRLSEIERLIRLHRIIVPAPTRRQLIELCDAGVFDTAPRKPGAPFLVFEDSFLKWIDEMDKSAKPRRGGK